MTASTAAAQLIEKCDVNFGVVFVLHVLLTEVAVADVRTDLT